MKIVPLQVMTFLSVKKILLQLSKKQTINKYF